MALRFLPVEPFQAGYFLFLLLEPLFPVSNPWQWQNKTRLDNGNTEIDIKCNVQDEHMKFNGIH